MHFQNFDIPNLFVILDNQHEQHLNITCSKYNLVVLTIEPARTAAR